MDGIINVYKEAGFTSHDVVAKLRGICRQKKIGHTGTLDPQATGVLPVCLGNATRACEMLTDRTKEYVAELLLGQITDTQDITGTVLEEREVAVSEAQVREVIAGFVGGYDQIPPMYSALKVNGKKLYELAVEMFIRYGFSREDSEKVADVKYILHSDAVGLGHFRCLRHCRRLGCFRFF